MTGFYFQEICIDMKSVINHLNIPTFWTQKYDCFSIRANTIYSWNSIQNFLIKNLSLKSSTSKKIKKEC